VTIQATNAAALIRITFPKLGVSGGIVYTYGTGRTLD
jgi:hypothetical protein